jgi:hypothetical protein
MVLDELIHLDIGVKLRLETVQEKRPFRSFLQSLPAFFGILSDIKLLLFPSTACRFHHSLDVPNNPNTVHTSDICNVIK